MVAAINNFDEAWLSKITKNVLMRLGRRKEDKIKIGEDLTSVRAKMKASGRWVEWVEKTLCISHDTATRYIQEFEKSKEPLSHDSANAESKKPKNSGRGASGQASSRGGGGGGRSAGTKTASAPASTSPTPSKASPDTAGTAPVEVAPAPGTMPVVAGGGSLAPETQETRELMHKGQLFKMLDDTTGAKLIPWLVEYLRDIPGLPEKLAGELGFIDPADAPSGGMDAEAAAAEASRRIEDLTLARENILARERQGLDELNKVRGFVQELQKELGAAKQEINQYKAAASPKARTEIALRDTRIQELEGILERIKKTSPPLVHNLWMILGDNSEDDQDEVVRLIAKYDHPDKPGTYDWRKLKWLEIIWNKMPTDKHRDKFRFMIGPPKGPAPKPKEPHPNAPPAEPPQQSNKPRLPSLSDDGDYRRLAQPGELLKPDRRSRSNGHSRHNGGDFD